MKLPTTYKTEARDEAYEYFDENIRELPKDMEGKIDPRSFGLVDNDVDAFRHAYVSGVLTQVYSESTADILGRLNEMMPLAIYYNSKDPRSLNMDLWNNSVGRKLGKLAKDKVELLKLVDKALKDGELIISLEDSRKYQGAFSDPRNQSKPIIVLLEDEKGRNEQFFDTIEYLVLNREQFVDLINQGKYPGYTVKQINGIATPVSLPDGRKTNNLT